MIGDCNMTVLLTTVVLPSVPVILLLARAQNSTKEKSKILLAVRLSKKTKWVRQIALALILLLNSVIRGNVIPTYNLTLYAIRS